METDLVSVDTIAKKATGTYEQTQAVLGKAEEYIKAAIDGAFTWLGMLPGSQTRENCLDEIRKLEQTLAVQAYPEQLCPQWEQARNLLWRAKSEYAATDEGQRRQVDIMLQFPRDLAVSAGETVGAIAAGVGEVAGDVAGGLLSGLGMTGVMLLGGAGLLAYFLLRKGA